MRLISLFFFIGLYCLNAQNQKLLYGFTDIPQSLRLNPAAEVKNNYYVGVPLLSGIYAEAGSTGVTAYDIFNSNSISFEQKIRSAILRMNNKDFFSLNQQLEIISGGFSLNRRPFERKGYISFGMYQETDAIVYFPKDYAVLAFEGNANSINKSFKLSDLRIKAELLSVFHIGYNHKVNEQLSLGIRGKVYSSVFNVTSTHNRGTFTTTSTSENNYYTHTFDMGLQANTAGLRSFLDENPNTSTDYPEIRNRLLLSGNIGFGIDLGFTYNLSQNWEVSGSLIDIGYIRHTKEVKNYSIHGYYEYEGLEILFPQQPNNSTQTNWDEIKTTYETLFDVKESSTSYTTWRPVKLYGSLSYKYNNQSGSCDCNYVHPSKAVYPNQVGIQLFAVNRPKSPLLSATGFYYKNIAKPLKLKLTYTVDSYSMTNIGLGTSIHIGGFNTYILADNLLGLQDISKAKTLSFQMGFNYIVK